MAARVEGAKLSIDGRSAARMRLAAVTVLRPVARIYFVFHSADSSHWRLPGNLPGREDDIWMCRIPTGDLAARITVGCY